MVNHTVYSANPFFLKISKSLCSPTHLQASLSLLTTEKLLNQIMELKFTSKSLQRQAKKCEKEEKSKKLKIKKAMEKGNIDGARISTMVNLYSINPPISISYTITLQDMELPLRRNEKFAEI